MADELSTTEAWLNVTLNDCEWNSTDWNNTNCTTEPPVYEYNRNLAIAYNAMLLLMTASTMYSMGAGVSLRVVKVQMKRPIGPIIGLVCQLFVMPAITFGIAHAFGFDGPLAVGMMLMSSSPGGAVSNIMTFWSRGDLDLR